MSEGICRMMALPSTPTMLPELSSASTTLSTLRQVFSTRCGDAAALRWGLAIPGVLTRPGGRSPALAHRALGTLRRRGRRLRLGCGAELVGRLDEGDLPRTLRLPAGALVVGRLVEAP